ncbi:MAG: SpaH/EbpB family LPXTG-anchored major pilin [Ruthenibacterium sp.]
MQKFKRISAIITTAFLLLSLAVPAAAAPLTGTVTMKDTAGATKTSSVYEAHRVVTWNASKVGSEVLYTDMALNFLYKQAIVDTLGAPLTAGSADAEVLKALSAVTDAAKMEALGVALSEVTHTADATATAGVFTALPYGYYLIRETENNANDGTVLSKPILVSVPDKDTGAADVSVTVKTSKANVTKDILRGEGASVTTAKSADVKIGDTVKFQLTASVPTYAANATGIQYFLTDTLSAGLTLDQNSVVVMADGKLLTAADYTVTVTGGNVLKIDFTYANIKNAKLLTATYSAVLNEKATLGATGNPNSVTLTYTNNPGTGTSYTTPEQHTVVYTTAINLTKVGGEKEKLAGAEFEIYSDAACTTPVKFYSYKVVTDATGTHVTTELEKNIAGKIITDKDGVASFVGLIAGDYYIKETKAPAGYDLLKQVIPVKISVQLPTSITTGKEQATWKVIGDQFIENNGVFAGEIVNTKGFRLPGTGGMGTTIFVICGVSLLVLAGGLFFVYSRKNRAKS